MSAAAVLRLTLLSNLGPHLCDFHVCCHDPVRHLFSEAAIGRCSDGTTPTPANVYCDDVLVVYYSDAGFEVFALLSL